MARVGIEWINKFPEPCDQNELSYCDETSEGFLNAMRSRGHTEVFNWGNGNAWERDFRDPAFSGDDANWADDVDFVHFSSHGSTNSSNVFSGFFGVQNDNCRWKSDKARFGNKQLEYLCIDACNSLELSRDVVATWQDAFHGMRMIFAFTDLVSDSWWTDDRGYRFGRRAGNSERLKSAWLDGATRSGATTTRWPWRPDAIRRMPRTGVTTNASAEDSATSPTVISAGLHGVGEAKPTVRFETRMYNRSRRPQPWH
jgi:hypothetical protein